VAAVTAGVSGVVIARALGPAERGEYAAITVWLVVAYTIADLGQTAATTFHVARVPHRRAGFLATSRLLTAISGLVMTLLGLLLAPMLTRHDPQLTAGCRITAVTCYVTLLGFGCTAALQAVDLRRWNAIRIAQPTVYLLVVGLLWPAGLLTLNTALWALLGTTAMQSIGAYLSCRTRGVAGGRVDPVLAGPLGRYGAAELAITVPSLAITRLDQLVLTGAGNPAGLGHYAVASSLTGLAVPLASALGNVAFPRLAAADLSDAGSALLRRRSLLAAAGIGLILTGGLALSAAWLVPAVFGADFRESITLIWWLAPTGVLSPATKVCADLIRGYGQPLAVAAVQAGSAALMAALLLVLVPAAGSRGAAVSASTAAVVSFLLMSYALRRAAHQAKHAPRRDRSPA
jgi:O-antigen/teichoic acid export membrane protein